MAASEIEKLERLVKENPKGRLFASLADAYRKDGQYPKALEVLDAGLKNHPEYVSARVVLGRVHMATGDRARAREAFGRVVELDPESVIALKALADLAEQDGESNEALRWSGQLLTVDPGNDEAIKQQERLAAAAPPAETAPAEPRLSGIVPIDMAEVLEVPAVAEVVAPEPTAAPFEAVKPPVMKTLEIPVVSTPSRPSFNAVKAPLDQPPEPLPLSPLSDEAQTEQVAADVQQMAALEPTSFEGGSAAPTERMAGLDPVGLSDAEVRAIGATPGFEPNSGDIDGTDVPRASLLGLETISGASLPNADEAPGAPAESLLELEQEIELGAASSNEFQEASTAETLQRRSGANEFQVSSDSDTLDASSASGADPLETGGNDLAFIEPSPELRASIQAPRFTPAAMMAEDPEPAVAEPEPVVTEAMAELYASQGHLAEALEVFRQLAARDPDDHRFADRIVELEMFVGGSAAPAPAMSELVDMVEEAAPVPVPAPADSLEEMELVPAPVMASGNAAAGARVTVGSWLADVFSQALPMGAAPVPAPAAAPASAEVSPPLEFITPVEDLAPPEPAAPVSDVAPKGSPTRQASGNFSLSNVFGEGGQGAPTAKTGSFDAFFGAPTGSNPAPGAQSGAPSSRTTRPSASATPPSDDDLSSFQDWLQGLKK
jgi:tetratricopeptide (TPR) repeat protein